MLLLFFSLMGLGFEIKCVSRKKQTSSIWNFFYYFFGNIFTKLPSWKLTKEGRTLSLVRRSPQMSRLVTSERWMVGESGQGIWLICRDREPSSLRLCRMSSKASLWGTRVGLLLDVTSCVSKGKFLCLTYESSKDMLNA